MSGHQPSEFRCPRCGFAEAGPDDVGSGALLRPWHVIHGREAVRAYVASLGQEAHEWLLALYVDEKLRLLAVDTVACGDVSSCKVPFWRLIDFGHRLQARGFILVHNHPSGDPRPSQADIQITRRLEDLARDAEMPLLNHLIVAGEDVWIIR